MGLRTCLLKKKHRLKHVVDSGKKAGPARSLFKSHSEKLFKNTQEACRNIKKINPETSWPRGSLHVLSIYTQR